LYWQPLALSTGNGAEKFGKPVSAKGNSPPEGRAVQPTPTGDNDHPRPVDDLCRCVRYLFETYHHEGDSTDEARRSHIRGCIETAASLVYCTEVQLRCFGEVGKVLHNVGYTEGTKERLRGSQ
jgi:hypothetical protein